MEIKFLPDLKISSSLSSSTMGSTFLKFTNKKDLISSFNNKKKNNLKISSVINVCLHLFVFTIHVYESFFDYYVVVIMVKL